MPVDTRIGHLVRTHLVLPCDIMFAVLPLRRAMILFASRYFNTPHVFADASGYDTHDDISNAFAGVFYDTR